MLRILNTDFKKLQPNAPGLIIMDITRRDFLKKVAIGGAAVAIGGAGVSTLLGRQQNAASDVMGTEAMYYG